MQIETFYDENTGTFTYLVIDEETKKSAIIDSVMDYDQFSAQASFGSADRVVQFIEQNKLHNQWILETHVHADHMTAAHYLKGKVGGQIAMSVGIVKVLSLWVPKFETENDTPTDGSQFDRLFEDGDQFQIGNLNVTVWHTQGHTPACASYLLDGAIFAGDTLFAPTLGTARCDFPGGSAKDLYRTIQRIYSLPEDTKVFLGHDYPATGQKPCSVVAVGHSKQTNILIKADTPLQEFVDRRQARDATLAVPKLLLPAIQANMRNGQFGAVSEKGQQFVKIPVSAI
ncbi:MBL fold metallo-hydrolase [Planctobacterium marinum]|uniref:Metallo-beta-lactamase domain-containing protein n=1 Tax=Planctobacterium marinum TaxID=1631968 RepID=A0AA48HFL1_9ALTE|nr:hypothetical protein MACH26_15740 [Planctobacterium marinum]